LAPGDSKIAAGLAVGKNDTLKMRPSFMAGTTTGSLTGAKNSCKAPFWATGLACAVIVLAALAAYGNSLGGAFIFDDQPAITDNPTIRHLWPLGDVLSPPRGTTVEGRPLLNLSLALNYAVSGTEVWSYHVLNLLIHVLAGLTLFGIVRRTLLRPVLREKYGEAAVPLAGGVALLWTVHPLQTEAVTYVIQRAESLMGLFYLLTLYCFIRSVDSQKPVRWQAASIIACLLGMATKEVMVSAPLMVFLYDRTFVAGTFAEAWKQRVKYYLGLAATWLQLGYLLLSMGGSRSGVMGFSVGVSWWAQWLTQFQAVVHYLWLSLWLDPLVFEYGKYQVKHAGEAVPYALVLIPLMAGTIISLWHKPAWGFLGLWFFAILAPTSLIPETTQMIVEHRMYLPLAAVLAGLVLGIHRLAGRRSLIIFLALAAGCGFLTARRNRDYRTELTIWSDTVAKRPDNALAHNDLGIALDKAGCLPEAIAQFELAARVAPDYAEARYNLGVALQKTGRISEAIGCFEEAVRLKPDYADAHYNLGTCLGQTGRLAEAIDHLKAAVRLRPDYAEAHNNLGIALYKAGRIPEAIAQFEEVLRINPDFVAARRALEKLQVAAKHGF
jgi:tetratricopeptide (TPR) repeat protein